MRSSTVICLVVALVCAALQVVAAGRGDAQRVQDKLEAYVEKYQRETGLSYEDYLAAYKDVKAHKTPSGIKDLKQMSPRFALFMDFVITPIDRWHPDITESPAVKQAYARRMEYAFKRFWPAYVDGKQLGKGLLWNAEKALKFIQTIQRSIRDPPTLELWHLAYAEYLSIKGRAEEMVEHEDIYEMLDDYETKLNFLDHTGVVYFIEKSADQFNKCKTTQDMQPIIRELRSMFGIY